ncbi:MAG: hypothetical protein WCK31_01730 [bacterium]
MGFPELVSNHENTSEMMKSLDSPTVQFPLGREIPQKGDKIKIKKIAFLDGEKTSKIPLGHESSTAHTLSTDIQLELVVSFEDSLAQTSPVLDFYSSKANDKFLFLTTSNSIYAVTEWTIPEVPAIKDRSENKRGIISRFLKRGDK